MVVKTLNKLQSHQYYFTKYSGWGVGVIYRILKRGFVSLDLIKLQQIEIYINVYVLICTSYVVSLLLSQFCFVWSRTRTVSLTSGAWVYSSTTVCRCPDSWARWLPSGAATSSPVSGAVLKWWGNFIFLILIHWTYCGAYEILCPF